MADEKVVDVKAAFRAISRKFQEEQKPPKPFVEFLTSNLAANPEVVLRNIFQLFDGMMHFYARNKALEQEKSLSDYDLTGLFADGFSNPFFVDSMISNRLMELSASLRQGAQQNKIYLLEGPPGSGKSIMLNNLLARLEEYIKTEEGQAYETFWALDVKKLGSLSNDESRQADLVKKLGDTFIVPCPHHDHPILQVPKSYRRELLEEIIADAEFKKKLFNEKEYEWVLNNGSCAICASLYQVLLERLGCPDDVFEMLQVRRYTFNRRLGTGITVLNASDIISRKELIFTNEKLQEGLDALLDNHGAIRYTFSPYAATNNGVFALMDAKDYNIDRLQWLHGLVSEGVHKVGTIEEKIDSLFLVTINPEDKRIIDDESSFTDRVDSVFIPYVRDYTTEVALYKNKFGGDLDKYFLPRVLDCFAKIIISTRLNTESAALKKRIPEPKKYDKYCDKGLLLLKMELYAGKLPRWLADDDRKNFTEEVQKELLTEKEGETGLSGRQSIDLFDHFYSQSKKTGKLITMRMLVEFFSEADDEISEQIPEAFMPALVRQYNYYVIEEIKESIYNYNKERISKDVLNYMYAINILHVDGSTYECPYTRDRINVTEDFLRSIESCIFGKIPNDLLRSRVRTAQQGKFRRETQEEIANGKEFIETALYRHFYSKYVQNIKQNVLVPFLANENFKFAIEEYGTENFGAYDDVIQRDVQLLLTNLQAKFKYTEEGAKQVCLYVIENEIVKDS